MISNLIKLILLLPTSMLLLSGCSPMLKPENVMVDNRNVEYYLKKNGAPTVVFESGLGGTMDWWSKVVPDLEKDMSVFAYNRAGYGHSTAVSFTRDGEHVVDELRSTLLYQHIDPPYILVGHSLGGLYMQYYARKYPNEVSALILVDSTHPDQFSGVGDPSRWPFTTKLVFNAMLSDNAKSEFDQIRKTGEEVLSLPTVIDKPVVVLSAAQPLSEQSELAIDSNNKRIDIVRLYPTAQQIWVDSGHAIPYEKPEAIIDAIRGVILKGN